MRAADAVQTGHPRFEGRGHDHRLGPGAGGDHLLDPCHSRWHRRHQKGRGQRIASARDIASYSVQRGDPLLHDDARDDARAPTARDLPGRDATDVTCRGLDSSSDRRRCVPGSLLNLGAGDLYGPADLVEPARVVSQGAVTAATDAAHDLSDPSLNLGID